MGKKVIALTGSGISAESGIKTFRDQGGLWEDHDIMEVASPEGWEKDPEKVLRFYNDRKEQLKNVEPNAAHKALAELEKAFDVHIITQNVDDLHERAGSSNVLHLHGELKKARSSVDENLVYDWEGPIHMGDKCDKGSQIRPNVVWFGEMVPMMEPAARLTSEADIVMVIGTSMVVYPAAGLIQYAPAEAHKYVIDPNLPDIPYMPNLHTEEAKASEGVPKVVKELLAKEGADQ